MDKLAENEHLTIVLGGKTRELWETISTNLNVANESLAQLLLEFYVQNSVRQHTSNHSSMVLSHLNNQRLQNSNSCDLALLQSNKDPNNCNKAHSCVISAVLGEAFLKQLVQKQEDYAHSLMKNGNNFRKPSEDLIQKDKNVIFPSEIGFKHIIEYCYLGTFKSAQNILPENYRRILETIKCLVPDIIQKKMLSEFYKICPKEISSYLYIMQDFRSDDVEAIISDKTENLIVSKDIANDNNMASKQNITKGKENPNKLAIVPMQNKRERKAVKHANTKTDFVCFSTDDNSEVKDILNKDVDHCRQNVLQSEWFFCEICDEKLKFKDLLEKHIQIEHGNCEDDFVSVKVKKTKRNPKRKSRLIVSKDIANDNNMASKQNITKGKENPNKLAIVPMQNKRERKAVKQAYTKTDFVCFSTDDDSAVEDVLNKDDDYCPENELQSVRFFCEICGEEFKDKELLEKHIQNEHGNCEDDFVPVKVKKTKRNSKRKSRHYQEDFNVELDYTDKGQKEKPVIGLCCDESFTLKSQIGLHLLQNHCSVYFECMFCKMFIQIEQIWQHFITIHKVSNDMQDKLFITDGIQQINSDKGVISTTVGIPLDTLGNLNSTDNVKDIVTNCDSNVSCVCCQNTMSVKQYVHHLEEQHIEAKELLKSSSYTVINVCKCLYIQCNICHETRLDAEKPMHIPNLLRAHINRYHLLKSAGDEKQPCPDCGNMVFKYSLKQHMNLQHNKNSWLYKNRTEKIPCEICGKLISKKRINTHKNEHVRRFPCPYCKKEFNRESNLKVHARIHTGEKPFVCDVCGKNFHQNIELRLHNKTHNKENNDRHPVNNMLDETIYTNISIMDHQPINTETQSCSTVESLLGGEQYVNF